MSPLGRMSVVIGANAKSRDVGFSLGRFNRDGKSVYSIFCNAGAIFDAMGGQADIRKMWQNRTTDPLPKSRS
jgi:hypothetical protein